ncbi:MAG: TIGR02996 domain-containing protein [Fimbriiglobus sp.]
MSDDERALLMTISNDWHAELPRLVYADWLDEQGRAKEAEQIRVEIEMAQVKKQLHRLPGVWEDKPPEDVAKLKKQLRLLTVRRKKCGGPNPLFRAEKTNRFAEFVYGLNRLEIEGKVPVPGVELNFRWRDLFTSNISEVRRKSLLENSVLLIISIGPNENISWFRQLFGRGNRVPQPVSELDRKKFFECELKRLHHLRIYALQNELVAINSFLLNLQAPCLAKLYLQLRHDEGNQLDWPQMPFASTLETLQLDCPGLTGASLATLTPERYPCLESLTIRQTSCTDEEREAIRQRWPHLRVDGRAAEWQE